MNTSSPVPDKEVDLSQMRCPHLIIAVIQALRSLQPRQILKVTAVDLNAPSNIAAWSRQSGNPLLEMYEENGRFIFFLQRLAQATEATPSFQDE